jgi:hypothetical protein
MSDQDSSQQMGVSRDNRITSRTSLPTFGTVTSILIIVFLIYAFFSGLSYQFYASFLFLFYGVTNSMWVSVMLLGVFQTLILVPLRIIRVAKGNNIKEFQQTIERIKDEEQQGFLLKKKFRQGNLTFLFYSVDFMIQLVSYISMGRLFLTDFYANKINPELLYSWVPYPEYPIQDIFFKIPYPAITETISLGWKVLLPVWIGLVIIQVLILMARRSIRSNKGKQAEQKLFSKGWSRYTAGYLLFFMLLAWFVVGHFPTGWDLRIFSGDISIPNRTFNTVTAIATFLVLLYHGIPKITRKGQLAERLGLDQKVIETTQLEMFKNTLFTATIVGLGAFYITNHIPSAFELSIFTLEVISLAAPFTVDKLVFKNIPIKPKEEDENPENVRHEFDPDGEIKEDTAE